MKTLLTYSSLCGIFLAVLVGLMSLVIVGCAPIDANITTTAGSTSATVDNPKGIAAAQTVTAPNLPAGESVGAINGDVLTFVIPALTTSTAPAVFTQTPASVFATAQTLIGNDLAYAESVAVQLQKVNTGLASFIGSTTSILNAAGLAPANSSQASVLAKITSALTKSGNAIAAVNQVLSPSNLAALTGTPTTYEESIPGPGEIAQQVALENAIHPRPLMEGNLNNDY